MYISKNGLKVFEENVIEQNIIKKIRMKEK